MDIFFYYRYQYIFSESLPLESQTWCVNNSSVLSAFNHVSSYSMMLQVRSVRMVIVGHMDCLVWHFYASANPIFWISFSQFCLSAWFWNLQILLVMHEE